MLTKFDLSTLVTLDGGRIAEAFEQGLRRAESDCRDRPLLKKVRTLTLSAALSPVVDDEGNLLEVVIGFQVGEAIPKRDSKLYHLNAARSGLFFNELSPDESRQMTLDTAKGFVPVTLPEKETPKGLRKDVQTDAG